MNPSIRVVCFLEDLAHEQFLDALIKRASQKFQIDVQISILSASHGSKVWLDLRKYLKDLSKGHTPFPDILVVAIDSDCKKYGEIQNRALKEIERANLSIPNLICAVPEPHIERWYVEDQQALQKALPGASIPKVKYRCEKDRYKQVLKEAIRAAGVEPYLGGAE